MRILVFSTDYPPALGGISRYSHEIARHLQILGDDVVVLSSRQDGGAAFDRAQNFPAYRASRFPSGMISLFTALNFIIKKHAVQKIFCPLWFPCASHVYLLGKLTKQKCPYAVAVHGSETFESRATFKLRLKSRLSGLRRQTFLHAEKIFPVSSYTKGKLIEDGLPEEKMSVVPNGVDTRVFKPLRGKNPWAEKLSLEGKKIMLTVARLDAHKGIDLTLGALPRVLKTAPDTLYLVAGTGPEESHLKSLARKLNVTDSVLFLGKISTDDELVSLYSCCDVFVMPSRELPGRMDLIEGFGIAYLEANACGKPVIGGKSGGVSDAVEDGVSGLLVNPESQDEITEAVLRLIQQKDVAEKLGENGRQRVEREFTWESAAKKIRKLMECE